MTEDRCYRHLNLPIQPFDIEYISTLPDRGHVPVPVEVVNRKLTDFMGIRGISIKNVDVFCSPPGFELGIHVDGVKLGAAVATNWAYCVEDGAVMQWWKPKSDELKVVDPSATNSSYGISTTPYALAWEEHEVDFLTECAIGKPTLVNIGIPHGMKNKTNSNRKAFSITWLYKGRSLNWDDALILLNDIIVR